MSNTIDSIRRDHNSWAYGQQEVVNMNDLATNINFWAILYPEDPINLPNCQSGISVDVINCGLSSDIM